KKDTGSVISKSYKVKKGDTLYSIARKLNISVTKLKQINNLKTNTISIDQVLKVK
ncbi:MAG: LysM repeat protein, partial [Patiriisocius sp.]